MKKKNNIYKRIGACILVALVSALMVLPCFASVDSNSAEVVRISTPSQEEYELELRRLFFADKNFWQSDEQLYEHLHQNGSYSRYQYNFFDCFLKAGTKGQLFLSRAYTSPYTATPSKYGFDCTVKIVYARNLGLIPADFVDSWNNQVVDPYNKSSFLYVGEYVTHIDGWRVYAFIVPSEETNLGNIAVYYDATEQTEDRYFDGYIAEYYVTRDCAERIKNGDLMALQPYFSDEGYPKASVSDSYIADAEMLISANVSLLYDYENSYNFDSAYAEGYEEGYNGGFDSGRSDGYNFGLVEGNADGREDGYSDGYYDGFNNGVPDGFDHGYAEGKNEGYQSGLNEGYLSGYQDGEYYGRNEGYAEGFEVGKTEGKPVGYEQGRTEGYQSAYNDAYDDITDTLNKNMVDLKENLGHSDGSFTEGFLAGMWNGMTSFTQTVLNGFTLSGLSLMNILATLLAIMVAAYIIRLIKG